MLKSVSMLKQQLKSDLDLQNWVDISKSTFNIWMRDEFNSNVTPASNLMIHQGLIKSFFDHPNSRGLLLYHGLGTGKTRTSIAVSEAQLISSNHKKAIVILPGSLRVNFLNELKAFNPMYRRTDSKWSKITDDGEIEDVRDNLKLSKDFVLKCKRTFGGLWFPYGKSSIVLSDAETQEIDKQCKELIEDRYDFISMNGLSRKSLSEFHEEYFNDKLIIIDEVHNLTMGLEKTTTIKYQLYKKLVESFDSKFILLSATPIVNKPNEIAYIVDLLKINKRFTSVKINEIPDKSSIENFVSNSDANMLEIEASADGKYILNFTTSKPIVRKDVLYNVNKMVDGYKTKIQATDIEYKDFIQLPLDEIEFNKRYVTNRNQASQHMFKRRIQGMISYFRADNDSSMFAQEISDETITCLMSEAQFDKYKIHRQKEKDLEKSKGDKQLYKVFSRMICNFAFPDSITRPYGRMKSALKEIDEISVQEYLEADEIDVSTKDVNELTIEYKNELKNALESLKENLHELLGETSLSRWSPKYFEVIKNIKKLEGNQLLYSDFRKVEGLNVFGMCLQANGISELTVTYDKKTDEFKFSLSKGIEDAAKGSCFYKYGDNKDVDVLMLSVYNNEIDSLPENFKKALSEFTNLDIDEITNLNGEFIKVFMISRSGAEGISLKNVRCIHILEPYWNNIRLDQVVGRANRMNSHIQLPEGNRNYRIYRYMTVFSEDQALYFHDDGGLTTDQIVQRIANEKEGKINGILNMLKEASIDCSIHKFKGVSCMESSKYLDEDDDLYSVDLKNDQVMMKKTKNKLESFMIKIVSDGFEKSKFIYVPEREAIYDPTTFEFVASMKKTKRGWVLTNMSDVQKNK